MREVLDLLTHTGISVVLEQHTATALEAADCQSRPRSELGALCDLIIVVGGDGSLLGIGRDLAGTRVPVIGVNRGGLGFLAGISPDQLTHQLSQVLMGEFVAEDHFLLEAWVMRDGEERSRSVALNDVVVHPGSMTRMLEFSLHIDGRFVYDQRSDGLIIASPTGSTARSSSVATPIWRSASASTAIHRRRRAAIRRCISRWPWVRCCTWRSIRYP